MPAPVFGVYVSRCLLAVIGWRKEVVGICHNLAVLMMVVEVRIVVLYCKVLVCCSGYPEKQ